MMHGLPLTAARRTTSGRNHVAARCCLIFLWSKGPCPLPHSTPLVSETDAGLLDDS